MDDLTQLLLTQLAGEDAGALSLADVVQQSLGDDPGAAPVLAALRAREARLAEEAAEQDAREGEALPADPEVADLLERLYAEVAELRERTATLAAALGACRRCFGEDELCPVCRGRGRPGGRSPDPVLFAELVEPAVARHAAAFADPLDPLFPDS